VFSGGLFVLGMLFICTCLFVNSLYCSLSVSADSGQGMVAAGFYEHGNEPSGSIKKVGYSLTTE
jgi:hypothetical protein